MSRRHGGSLISAALGRDGPLRSDASSVDRGVPSVWSGDIGFVGGMGRGMVSMTGVERDGV